MTDLDDPDHWLAIVFEKDAEIAELRADNERLKAIAESAEALRVENEQLRALLQRVTALPVEQARTEIEGLRAEIARLRAAINGQKKAPAGAGASRARLPPVGDSRCCYSEGLTRREQSPTFHQNNHTLPAS